MSLLELAVASKDPLSVRRFAIPEAVSPLFDATVSARSKNADIDLAACVGHTAAFRLTSGVAHLAAPVRAWTGVCCHMEQLQPEPTGLSTYRVTIAPALWLATQRR